MRKRRREEKKGSQSLSKPLKASPKLSKAWQSLPKAPQSLPKAAQSRRLPSPNSPQSSPKLPQSSPKPPQSLPRLVLAPQRPPDRKSEINHQFIEAKLKVTFRNAVRYANSKMEVQNHVCFLKVTFRNAIRMPLYF